MSTTPQGLTNTVSPPPASLTQGPSNNAPAPIQAFGANPSINPTYTNSTGYNATTVDPYGAQQAYQQYVGQLTAGLQPTFQQQTQSEEDQLAARGIQDSGAAQYNMNQLTGEQAATVAQQEAAMTQQMYGYQQSDVAANQAAQNAAAQFGAQAANVAGLTNASAANSASQYNANAYANARNQNYDAYNSYESALLGYGANQQSSLLAAYLNSFDPQSGVTSAINSGLSSMGAMYGNTYNQILQDQAQQNAQNGQNFGLGTSAGTMAGIGGLLMGG
jgi:hypothetical protein